ncbi:MAG: methyltransferase domain-containing protein [Aggregatilineales bacterium]
MDANFDRVADIYDATRGFSSEAGQGIAAFIAEKAKLKSTDKLLEVGIGTGRVAVPLSAHIDHIYGVDIARLMMQKIHEKSVANTIHLSESDATQLPFADSSFDACLSVHVFHLIPDMESCMQEINRVLNPEGILLYASGPFGEGFADLNSVWNQHTPKYTGARNQEQVDELLTEYGWHIPEIEYQHPLMMQRRPDGLLTALKGRVSSQTWRMTDDEIAAAIVDMEAALAENYPEPDKPVAVESKFHLRVYQRS